MPTARARVMVTETDEVAHALDVSRRAWPEETSRARLLGRLAVLGGQQLDAGRPGAVTARRRQLLRSGRESLRGMFAEHHREQLRDEWPE